MDGMVMVMVMGLVGRREVEYGSAIPAPITMLPTYLANIVSRAQATEGDAQRRERVHAGRGFLLVDRMAEELDVWCE